MSYLEELKERNLIAQITHEDELHTHLQTPRTAYIGFDPTAPSLHVGNLMALLMAKRWQRHGHRIIILLGGGTAMIGDPTGKTEMRNINSVETIDARVAALKPQFARFIDFSDPARGFMVNNGDWLRDLQYVPFLREIGAHFNVNRMLDAECFKQRMDKGLSFLEFNYMIMQGYDFLELYRRHSCTLQLGGDDQWSNMLAGVDLVRKIERTQAFCLTNRLLVTQTGQKMGKTEKGALWLDEEMTSPYEFFQYFRNIEDQDVGTILRYLTDIPMSEVLEMEKLKDAAINEAKIRAAFEITSLVHGPEKARKAQEMAQSLFTKGGSHDAPELAISLGVGESRALLEVLVETKVCPSKSEGRRLIQQGGIHLDGKMVPDDQFRISHDNLVGGLLLQVGKKRFYKLVIPSK